MLLAALYLPALTLAGERPLHGLSAAMTSIGIIACWGISSAWSDVNPVELLRCSMRVAAFAFALAGAASALARLRWPSPLPAGCVAVFATLWLSWPVWLSHALTQSRQRFGCRTSSVRDQFRAATPRRVGWHPIAYQRLTILNQDIPYHFPPSVFPAVIVHGVIATIGFAIALRPPPAASSIPRPTVQASSATNQPTDTGVSSGPEPLRPAPLRQSRRTHDQGSESPGSHSPYHLRPATGCSAATSSSINIGAITFRANGCDIQPTWFPIF